MNSKTIIPLATLALVLAGCANVGNAPTGNEAGRQQELKTMSLQQKIDDINRAPIPPEEKQRQIDALTQKEGGAPTPGAAQGYGKPNNAGG